MALGVEALITPEVIRWARETAKMTLEEAAFKFKRPTDVIEGWESGKIRPTLPQVRRASTVYKRPLAVFYLPNPPEDFQTLRDFRSFGGQRVQAYSAQLDLLIREARYRQERVKEIVIAEGSERLGFVGSKKITDDPQLIAKEIRQNLKITYEQQKAFKTTREAFKIWMLKAEDMGIFIFRRRTVKTKEARGFLISDDYAPLIFINSDDSDSGQIFTLVHELGHLWLGISGVSDLEVASLSGNEDIQRIEIFCNRVASNVLIEQQVFSQEWAATEMYNQTRPRIEEIAKTFKVSREMIARRLLDNKVISNDFYQELRHEYHDKYIESKEKKDQKMRDSEGGPSYYRKTASNLGHSLIRTVVAAYLNGTVSARDATDILSVKINNMRNLAKEVGLLV